MTGPTTRPVTSAPPAALLRLRAADIVRLCGFAAATRGLELVDRHAVTSGRREGARLEASVADERPCRVSVELHEADGDIDVRWSCTVHAGNGGRPGEPSCAHVAALLTAWVRAPADFAPRESGPPAGAPIPTETSPPLVSTDEAQPAPPQVRQPRLIGPPRAARPRGEGLADELKRMPSAELLAMARRVLGTDLALHEARDQLAATLADPAAVRELLARLDAGPQALYAALHLLGGAITAGDLDAMAVRGDQAPAKLRAELAVLARHGLIFAAPGQPSADRMPSASAHDALREPARHTLAGWRIPRELRAAVPMGLPLDPLPSRSPLGPPIVPVVPDGQVDAPSKVRIERGTLRPLCLALVLLARAPAPLGPLQRSADDNNDGKTFREHARGWEPARTPSTPTARVTWSLGGDLPAARLAALARAAGLDPVIVALARRLLLLAHEQAPAHPLTDLARVPPAERLLALHTAFEMWREAETAGELADLELSGSPLRAHFDASHPAFDPIEIAREVAGARRFVLRLLSAARPGAWYALDDLVDLVWRLNPYFLRGRQQAYQTPAWWLERTGDGERRPLQPTVRDDWRAGEGEFVRWLLTQMLRAWGILDCACRLDGRLVAVRVTPFGNDLMSGASSSVQGDTDTLLAGDWGSPVLLTRAGDLAVQPLAVGPDLLDALDRWAQPTGIAGARLLYALAPDLAAAAFDHDASPDDLPARLRTADPHAGARAAEAVARRLAAWHASYAAASIEKGWALLEARDAATLVEALAAMPGLLARCRRLDDSRLLIPPADLPSLRAALARRGYRL